MVTDHQVRRLMKALAKGESLTTLREKLVKIGAEVLRHARDVRGVRLDRHGRPQIGTRRSANARA